MQKFIQVLEQAVAPSQNGAMPAAAPPIVESATSADAGPETVMVAGSSATHDHAGASPASVRVLAIVVFVLAALQIVNQGFLPPDDALRYAAKVVSGRHWNEILVLRPGTVESSPGWHAILAGVFSLRGGTGGSTSEASAAVATLVTFEVVSLFAFFSLFPVLLLRRVEAWLAAMLAVSLLEPILTARLVVGRPLVFSMAVVVAFCLLWSRLESERRPVRTQVALGALVAAATWIHGSWYLFFLPIAACLFAGRIRVTRRLLVATAAGIAAGAALTGHPIRFLWSSIRHGALAFSDTQPIELVREFRPYPGAPILFLGVLLLIVMRQVLQGASPRRLARDPVFMLGALGAVLGLRVARFWMDWGLPAVVAFVALEIEALWLARRTTTQTGAQRMAQARGMLPGVVLAAICFLALTADVGNRWSRPSGDPAYQAMLAPEHRSALPDSGGILYADDMRAFYDLFFLAPRAPWRYVLGYEPGLMPPEDLAVYRNALLTRDVAAFEPWARKLRQGDRLVIHYDRGIPPLGLEWQYIGYNVWSGRVRSAPSAQQR